MSLGALHVTDDFLRTLISSTNYLSQFGAACQNIITVYFVLCRYCVSSLVLYPTKLVG